MLLVGVVVIGSDSTEGYIVPVERGVEVAKPSSRGKQNRDAVDHEKEIMHSCRFATIS